MADYREIQDLEVQAGRVATSQTAFALRDNPLAVAEGADGATRIVPWALVLDPVAAGSLVRYHANGEWNLGLESGREHQVAGVLLLASGTVTVKASHRGDSSGAGGSCDLTIIRGRGGGNNNEGSWSRSDGSDWVERSTNVAVLPGDSIYVRLSRGGPSGQVRMRDFQIATSGGYFWAFGEGSLVLPPAPA